jgi:tRNA G37 N-methylase Trm5
LNALSNSLIQQQKDFLQAAVKITNGGGTAHTLKDEVHPVADETNGELDEATDLEGDSNSVIHQIIPVFEDEHHGAANTVHEVSFSSFSHSYERDHDRDLSYGLTRGQ